MKKKLGVLVFILLMLLTSCSKGEKVNNENRKEELSKELLTKAYDEYCLDFNDLSYDEFYNEIGVSYFKDFDMYTLFVSTLNDKYFCLVSDSKSLLNKDVTKYTKTGKESTIYLATYDEAGKCYCDRFETYNYDELDNIKSSVIKGYWPLSDKISDITTNEYINNVVRKKTTLLYNQSGDCTGIDLEEFNEDGKEVLYSKSKYINGEAVEYYRDELEYDENGKIVSKVYYDTFDGKFTKTLDTKIINGKECEFLKVAYAYTAYVPSYKWEREYDSQGNVTQKIYSEYVDHEWVLIDKYDYDYRDLLVYINDEPKSLVVCSHYKWENNEWVLKEKTESYI